MKAVVSVGISRWRFFYLLHMGHGRINVENVRKGLRYICGNCAGRKLLQKLQRFSLKSNDEEGEIVG